MPNEIAVGIDLGTTNSVVSFIDPSGRSAMVPNIEGDLLTPSVVLFEEGEVIVGKDARSATTVHPDRVAEWVKRDMGAPLYSRPIRGEYLPPEVIQACILRKLKTAIQRELGSDVRIVITVPAYFDEPRRKATADAGEMAGFTVLDIVNEPTAAALAFCESLGYLSPKGSALQELNLLVYDLGGGTFDVTMLHLAPGDIRTLATDGDVQLGGHDWDLRLVEYVAETFCRSQGVDPREDPASINRIFNSVIEAKHTLTARSRTAIRCDHAGHTCEVPIARQQFEEMTADLLERTAYTTRQLLTDSKLRWSDVSRVLLVGGSTRMPMVSQMLQQMTGMQPDRTVNPDEAVARGAAVYAQYLLAKRSGAAAAPGFEVTNVNAHSLGIEGISPETLRKTNVILIPRNTPLPARATERFITKSDGQRSIVVQILQGESSLPGECTAIGRGVIRDLPEGLPRGWPVEVTFEYQANGRLKVLSVVPGTHRELTLELERNVGLSHHGVERWKQVVSAASGFSNYGAVLQEQGYASAPSGPQSAESAAHTATSGHWALESQPDFGGGPGASQAPSSPTPQPHPQPRPISQPRPLERREVPRPSSSQPQAGGAAVPAHGVSGSRPQSHDPHGPAGASHGPPPYPPAHPAAATQSGPGGEANVSVSGGRRKRLPHWAFNLFGHISAAVIGLGLGYLVLAWLRPDVFPWPW